MQQHLLSPALPPPPTDILPTPSPQGTVSSTYPDSTMTTTITVKRKRTDITDTTGVTRPVVKKKKANRACIHCQKAHLTCDDGPCFRPNLHSKFSFRVSSQHNWFVVPQQDPVNDASSVVCQMTALKATERKPNTSSTTKSSVSVRFPRISRPGDLILTPTHKEALQREKGAKHVKGANNSPKKKQGQLEIQQPRIVSPEPVQMAQSAPIPTCSQPLPHSFG